MSEVISVDLASTGLKDWTAIVVKDIKNSGSDDISAVHAQVTVTCGKGDNAAMREYSMRMDTEEVTVSTNKPLQ